MVVVERAVALAWEGLPFGCYSGSCPLQVMVQLRLYTLLLRLILSKLINHFLINPSCTNWMI